MNSRSSAPRPFLCLRNATFRLGDRLVFADTSWTFQRHQHWAVIGPNGSGKSWFADALRGRLPLVRGELRYGFRPGAGLAPEDAIGHVGFEDRQSEVHGSVLQSRWQSIEEESALRVGEYLSYERVMDINPYEVNPAHDGNRAQFEPRRRHAVALLDLAPFLDRNLFSLSHGERQRVQWARALCLPLRLLILDEPFNGLDAAARARSQRLLEHLMRTPLRLLFIAAQAEDVPRGIRHVLEVEHCRVVRAAPRARFPVPNPQAKVRGSDSQVPRAGLRTATGKVLVDLRNITVRYGNKAILTGVDWTVRAGESWALLGPNGAGKSTLLSLILGDHPQAYVNDVTVFGRRRGHGESIWEIKRHIGAVSPELHLHFNGGITCLDTVASGFQETIGLFEPATPRRRTAARTWLKRFELLGWAEAPLLALSLGQQRMVLLARALVKQPRLLILDEPCQVLDLSHRQLVLGAIEGLLRDRVLTVIYVTHRPEEIPASIRRVLRLDRGIAKQGLADNRRA